MDGAGRSMFCVVLCELARPLQQEEEALGALLGLAPYDVRVRLAGVLPQTILRHEDRGHASRLGDALRERGHGILVFDINDAPSLAAMTQMHRFAVDGGQLFANDPKPPSRPLDGIVTLLDAVMVGRVERKTFEVEYRTTNRGTVRESKAHTRNEQTAEHALILRWRDSAPWILRASVARYLALGPRMRPTVQENFVATAQWLRELAPGARYDNRFVGQPLSATRAIQTHGHESASPISGDRGIEITLHALGLWLDRSRQGPYR